MAAKRRFNTLSQLQKAILLYMFEQEYTPTSRFISCRTIIMGFIEYHGNYFCDSISEIKRALYAMSHLWEYEIPYIEANGFTGEMVEDKNGKISTSDGADMWCVECRLSQAGINYVINHKSLYSLKNLFDLRGSVKLQIKPYGGKPWQLTRLHESLLRYMATRGYWPTKQYAQSSNVIVDFIEYSSVDYTDSISSVVDALYELTSIRVNNEVFIDMQCHKGEGPDHIEIRLSTAGLDFVITNNLVNKLWAYRHRS